MYSAEAEQYLFPLIYQNFKTNTERERNIIMEQATQITEEAKTPKGQASAEMNSSVLKRDQKPSAGAGKTHPDHMKIIADAMRFHM